MGDELFKSFDDFVLLACRTYHRPYWSGYSEQVQQVIFSETKKDLCKRLKKLNLQPRAIVSYINWASLGTSFRQIEKHLGIKRMTVCRDLQQLRDFWPHLFRFGPPIPKVQDMSKLPENFDEYLEEGHNVEKF